MLEDSTGTQPYTRRLGGDATYWTMGVYLLTWLAEGKDTGGQFSLAEVVIPKAGGEPPPHTHTREDEAYYILEGEFTFRIGGQNVEAGPGDYVWLPRGIEHGFELKTPEAKALISIFPAGLEEFFKRLSEPAQSPTLPPPPEEPPDFGGVAALMEEYGVKLSPPPPAPL
jgi:quercetin dioxygenase-like cupin family protein